MNLKDIQSVYFIGIGGIGMSALARYFKFIGKKVAGYDKTQSPITDELVKMDIDIHYVDNPALIDTNYKDADVTLIVYTPAVSKNHSELNYFIHEGFTVKKRSQVLGIITKDSFCFAVAGTHGKTTTSSILAHLLKETGTPLTAFLGGISEDFNSNFVLEGTEFSVVEADEYDRSFLQLSPNVACITSMDADHLDIYGTDDELTKSFREFAAKLKPNGKLLIRNGLPIDGITYGIEDASDYCITNIKVEKGTYVFDIKTPFELLKEIRFNKPGRHNLLNGLAAFAMASQAISNTKKLAGALETFKGVQRRFSYQIKADHLIYIDDYAHHPTEIDAVYEAVKEMHPDTTITAVFQPHLYSRTKDFIEDFARSLAKFDCVLLLDIYPAREEPIDGVTSLWLLGKIQNDNKKLIDRTELVNEIKRCKSDILVTMGAGDIGLEVSKIKNELAYAN
ncbi:MAG: UDP-N-acetylmuramate--L-alanine ligase [Croceitalea sp.]|nr:UDP-N-acetylmuramate--L-alanine ligase [Croceitalea sp.]